jgi:hypothetical protein
MYSHKQWLIAWIKKILGVASPSLVIEGYKYEYDFMKRNYRRKHK